MGNIGTIRPGEIQRMSAGTGIHHSEYNPSEKDPVHLIQLWIMPAIQNLRPSPEQKGFSLSNRAGGVAADKTNWTDPLRRRLKIRYRNVGNAVLSFKFEARGR